MFADLSVLIMGDDGTFRKFVMLKGYNNGHVPVVRKHCTATLLILILG